MRSFFSKIIALLFMFAFLQIPFFMMQYMQHLEGHFQELKLYREQLEEAAKNNDLTLTAYVLHFESNADKVVSSQGNVMTGTLKRYDSFAAARQAYREATPWGKPLVFLRHIDNEMVSETFSKFEVGFNLSLESLCYMAVGFLLSLLVGNPFKRRVQDGNIQR